MSKAKQQMIIAAVAACIALTVAAVLLIALPRIPQDDISITPISEFHIDIGNNYFEQQESDDCAAYASAFVLRHFGDSATGYGLSGELKRSFGFVSADSVVELLESHGCKAAAYSGSFDTLKQRLSDGVPVIVFVQNKGDTHYEVVVGFDEENIYLVDSLSKPATDEGAWYNKKLNNDQFMKIWKTDIYSHYNIYIVAEQMK